VTTALPLEHLARSLAPFCESASLARSALLQESAPAVRVWLAALRLPHVASDLLVTLHVPPGDAAAAAGGEALLLALLASFTVVHWTLFG